MRRLSLIAAAGLMSLGGCAAPVAIVPAAPAPATQSPGMVSAADPRAAQAGAEILRAGGSAADSAIATLVALTVVEPQSSGIGGGGFLVYSAGGQQPLTIDGRETAPAAADGKWFYEDGKPMPIDRAIPGGKSVGVPGNVQLMAQAHRRFGRLLWARLFDPAIRLARDGFAVTPRFRESLDRFRATGALSPEARALFYAGNGEPKPVGAMVRNPVLAEYLEHLAAAGPDSFYRGGNAHAIVATVNGSRLNPSRMSAPDIAAYRAIPREAVCGTYRGYRICGMGPPSSGATTVYAILKQLERFDLGRLGPGSPTSWHLFAESTRLAFADRDIYLADPSFVRVPVAGLTDARYLASRSAMISPTKTLTGVVAGDPVGAPPACPAPPAAEAGTSHFVAVDRWGNVASLTSTIESAFGSGLMVNGYYLNNELTDFNFEPVRNGCAVANRVEGGKRPRSSMSPTIVYGPDGDVRLAVGAAGGATIIAQVAKAIIGVVDWKLSAQDAIALPMLFAPGDTVLVEKGTSLEAMIPALEKLGHKVVARDGGFKANAIERIDGRWVGAADPRSEGTAVAQ
ncbi:gamma-glutamyltransferase family protein [Sphingomonas sinipercae]|uniref:Gamma-glutamyltransferase family protein n=1 Tax=Sphingomonas sinipercae TaxID=2714944 RepID=A0A6G7ZL73_9SPHN|nr:gamma-glutamyltransferase family protein [Sphingomonas sinipercae]QIL01669.1 gamma-glutamyltransferase family protein [Sphingomonas sinipercae]